MSDIKDTIDAIIGFLSRVVGNHHWIYLVSLCLVCWCGFYLSNSLWFLLSSLFLSLILVISFLVTIYHIVAKQISKSRTKKRVKEQEHQNELLKEKQKVELVKQHASLIWHYVGYFDKVKIEDATVFLTFQIHDGNKYVRFIKRPNVDDYKGTDEYWRLYNRIGKYQFNRPHYNKLSLLDKTDIYEGFYVKIEPYFYSLLENYLKNGKWEKL